MQSKTKRKRVVSAKRMFTIFARREGYTYQDIADFLNYADHTSAMHLMKTSE